MKTLTLVWAVGAIIPVLAGCHANATQEDSPPTTGVASQTTAEGKRPYALSISVSPAALKVGEKAEWNAAIAPEAPWVLKLETPLEVKLSACEGLSLEKTLLGKDEVVDPAAPIKTVRTVMVAKQKGACEVAANLSFFLCTDQVCQRFLDEARVSIRSE
jgi:hypothetical protein